MRVDAWRAGGEVARLGAGAWCQEESPSRWPEKMPVELYKLALSAAVLTKPMSIPSLFIRTQRHLPKMKTASLVSVGLCALGVLASEPLTPDKVEADITTS